MILMYKPIIIYMTYEMMFVNRTKTRERNIYFELQKWFRNLGPNRHNYVGTLEDDIKLSPVINEKDAIPTTPTEPTILLRLSYTKYITLWHSILIIKLLCLMAWVCFSVNMETEGLLTRMLRQKRIAEIGNCAN